MNSYPDRFGYVDTYKSQNAEYMRFNNFELKNRNEHIYDRNIEIIISDDTGTRFKHLSETIILNKGISMGPK